jgi:benzoyl-CoA 2,3-dioxygenase component B
MLTEEAHHMFVGETGVLRVVERTAQQMKEHGLDAGDSPDKVRKLGLIDLPTMQKYLNLWYSLSLDLFGGEISSNAATYFATGMKGRAKEDQFEDHKALEGVYGMDVVKEPSATGERTVVREEIAMRNAMTEVLRDAYVEDCQRGVDKWNRTIASHGIDFKLTLPSRRFHRHIGIYAGTKFDPSGSPIDEAKWEAKKEDWLPSEKDKAYVQSLMQAPVFDAKQMANWIAAPKQGIKGRPVDFDYVRHDA